MSNEVCGEKNPGFSLWTSSHGFHHLALSNRKGWKCIWAFILIILVLSLACCIIYYFYYVFSTAVYSRFTIESPAKRIWPTTIICEKQVFTSNKINSINSFTTAHASLLSWSLAPELTDPEIYSTNVRVPTLTTQINQVLKRQKYGNNLNKLLSDLVPNCAQFILQCQVGPSTYTGKECCGTFFNAQPIINRYGTCFSTKSAELQHEISVAGEGSGLTVVTMHDPGNPFDRSLAPAELIGTSGVTFAIVDGFSTVEASIRGRGQTVPPGKLATIGISRSYTDNYDLEFSAIGRMKCTPPGTISDVDNDLIYGLSSPYGYTKDSCTTIAKRELLARELLDCSFLPTSEYSRCNPLQSTVYFRSFIDNNKTDIDRIDVLKIKPDSTLEERYAKECLQDCAQDRYSLSQSFSDFSDDLKRNLGVKIADAGAPGTTTVVMLKFFLNSMEYTKIHNFPQHGLQFVAEVGGLMAFFLGLSIVSILECLCYGCSWCCNKCDSPTEEEERLRQIWQDGMMNNDIHPVPDEASRRAQQRQEEFNRMEARLRQMDYHMNERSPARQFLQNQI